MNTQIVKLKVSASGTGQGYGGTAKGTREGNPLAVFIVTTPNSVVKT